MNRAERRRHDRECSRARGGSLLDDPWEDPDAPALSGVPDGWVPRHMMGNEARPLFALAVRDDSDCGDPTSKPHRDMLAEWMRVVDSDWKADSLMVDAMFGGVVWNLRCGCVVGLFKPEWDE